MTSDAPLLTIHHAWLAKDRIVRVTTDVGTGRCRAMFDFRHPETGQPVTRTSAATFSRRRMKAAPLLLESIRDIVPDLTGRPVETGTLFGPFESEKEIDAIIFGLAGFQQAMGPLKLEHRNRTAILKQRQSVTMKRLGWIRRMTDAVIAAAVPDGDPIFPSQVIPVLHAEPAWLPAAKRRQDGIFDDPAPLPRTIPCMVGPIAFAGSAYMVSIEMRQGPDRSLVLENIRGSVARHGAAITKCPTPPEIIALITADRGIGRVCTSDQCEELLADRRYVFGRAAVRLDRLRRLRKAASGLPRLKADVAETVSKLEHVNHLRGAFLHKATVLACRTVRRLDAQIREEAVADLPEPA
ncbi:hypothetical protein LAZ40_04540 [Cereibacter sphaeroides]|uniref:hypothetical protein n=1 Tax=Cereibacter sphaeroides TaxID=1063 RepID=UPI001F3A083B|nr:hypothetical protein [Cereibacter sphaeroides]MCE6958324.1 hypothetical protein [Cereibacter sphaeroides]MCE6971934.1 hypothetical protein [Cereibacter sphaeroides]